MLKKGDTVYRVLPAWGTHFPEIGEATVVKASDKRVELKSGLAFGGRTFFKPTEQIATSKVEAWEHYLAALDQTAKVLAERVEQTKRAQAQAAACLAAAVVERDREES